MAKILGNLSSNSTKGEIKAFNAISAIPDEDLNLLCYYEPIIGGFHQFQKKTRNLALHIVEHQKISQLK